jgi:hypothetical protein
MRAVSEANPESRLRMGLKSQQIIDGYSPRHWADEVARLVTS